MIIGFGNLYSQNINDSLLVEFFNKTFNDYFIKRSERSKTKEYYIVKDSSMPEGVATDYASFKLHFIDGLYQVCTLVKKGKISTIFSAESRCFEADTIVFFIDDKSVNFKRVFRIQRYGKMKWIYSPRCYYNVKSGLVYYSVGKFIYDNETGEWKHITH